MDFELFENSELSYHLNITKHGKVTNFNVIVNVMWFIFLWLVH